MNIIHRWTAHHARAWTALATRLGLRGNSITESRSDTVIEDAEFAKEFDLIKDQRTRALGGDPVTKSPSPK